MGTSSSSFPHTRAEIGDHFLAAGLGAFTDHRLEPPPLRRRVPGRPRGVAGMVGVAIGLAVGAIAGWMVAARARA